MDPPTNNLKVVHIPCQNSSICSIPVQLIDVDSQGLNKDGCSAFEKQLGHVPDVKSIGKSTKFSWPNRCLAGISVNTVPDYWEEAWQADYMMYLCLDAGAGLPPNEYLNQMLEEAKEKVRGAPRISAVYGDALVFIKEPKSIGYDESERAKYKNMHEDFVLGMSYDGRTKALLRKILVNPTVVNCAAAGEIHATSL